ncbi:MAG: YiiX/YebB-like N1pC/P60 family cysteine hydrolase [Chitinophagaceae bacterium]
MKRFFFIFLFLFFIIASCDQQKQEKNPLRTKASIDAGFRMIDSAKSLIQNGDVIFRNGNDEVSRAARSMNRKDTSFSHCGLVFIENDSLFVYHALGGIYNPSQQLRREPLDSFCNPAENNAIGIYRYYLKNEQEKKLRTVVLDYYHAGLKFDLFFNYQSDDVMYCSEFVFKSLDRSADGGYARYVRLDTIPFGVTTDDIFLNENCRLIKKQSFR